MLDCLNQLWPSSRVLHGFAPIFLPYAPSPTDVREWKVEIIPPPAANNFTIPPNGVLRVSLHRILIEAGIALSSATSSWDPRTWFALYRYGSDFSGTAPHLRFYGGARDKDPRLTAIASEEVALGITNYLLREHFALDHIADAYECLQRGELMYVNRASKLRPDYFCKDSMGETVLAESKGATGTRSAITRRINNEGLAQVQNVVPVKSQLRRTCGRVVIGTHFCIEGFHGRSETTTIIRDPDGMQGCSKNAESDMLIRLAYAKVLRFSGHDSLAERLILRNGFEGRELSDYILRNGQRIPILPLAPIPFGGLICLYLPTANALFSGENEKFEDGVHKSIEEFRRLRGELGDIGYTLPNGVVIIHY